MSNEIIPFWQAMKYESEGKTVQYYGESYAWADFKIGCLISDYHKKKWRVKPEPVKYSVDIWLDKAPIFDANGCNFANYMLGAANWIRTPNSICNKKCTITVECEV